MGDCQNYGPFLGPYYNTGPNTGPSLGDPKKDHNFDNPPDHLQFPCCRGQASLSFRWLTAAGPQTFSAIWYFPKTRGPQYRPPNTILLIMGTPKKPLILGNPHISPRIFFLRRHAEIHTQETQSGASWMP